METNVHTPQVIFNLPQRLLVPLFQRPYVWTEENQWRPLWQDVQRVTERVLQGDYTARHFLGAAVLQQEPSPMGTMLTRTVIDGQQRLTTLQLLFDAIFEQVSRLGLSVVARRVGDLVENPSHHCREPEDRFKVWPTNRDRSAFSEVMGTPDPDYATLASSGSRISQAHKFFAHQVKEWLTIDPVETEAKASALVDTVTTRLQMVVIDLKSDEDAQEIFETLNARGTPLTAADLIKNLVFQRLGASPDASEKAYHEYWEQFETRFWEQEVSSGRVLWSRSSLFLTQWLASRTREDVPAREVFASFKRYLDTSGLPVGQVLSEIKACADIFQTLTQASENRHAPLSRLELFFYRIGEMQSEIVKPVVIWLTDPSLPAIPEEELDSAVGALESWLVRRMLVREKSAGQNRFMIDLLGQLVDEPREMIGGRLRSLLADQVAETAYWPDDAAVRASLEDLQIYRRISRGRLRMVLEAIEDHRRGFTGKNPKGEAPIMRATSTIEHVMPQSWGQHWPLTGEVEALERDKLVQTLGNLTLVSKALNPSMSNASWGGPKGKGKALETYSTIKITADVLRMAHENGDSWDEDLIEERTNELIDQILEVWPVPEGHRNIGRTGNLDTGNLTLLDLIAAGLISPGEVLVPARKSVRSQQAMVTENGQVELGGVPFDTPSGAGKAVLHRTVNGWTFWRVGSPEGPMLSELRTRLSSDLGETDLGPYSQESLADWWTAEIPGLEELALAVTDHLPYWDKKLPSMHDKGSFRIARYWAQYESEPFACIGIPSAPPVGSSETPIWMRYSATTNGFEDVRDRLLSTRSDAIEDCDTGAIWIPLQIDDQLSGQELVDNLVEQVKIVHSTAVGKQGFFD